MDRPEGWFNPWATSLETTRNPHLAYEEGADAILPWAKEQGRREMAKEMGVSESTLFRYLRRAAKGAP